MARNQLLHTHGLSLSTGVTGSANAKDTAHMKTSGDIVPSQFTQTTI